MYRIGAAAYVISQTQRNAPTVLAATKNVQTRYQTSRATSNQPTKNSMPDGVYHPNEFYKYLKVPPKLMPEQSDVLKHLYDERRKNLSLQEHVADNTDRVDELKQELDIINDKITQQKQIEGIVDDPVEEPTPGKIVTSEDMPSTDDDVVTDTNDAESDSDSSSED